MSDQTQRAVFVGNRRSLDLLRTLEFAGVRTLAELSRLPALTIVHLLSDSAAAHAAASAASGRRPSRAAAV